MEREGKNVVRIVRMDKSHALPMARLHQEQIATGFLSSLGVRFLRQFYTALPTCPSGFAFVALDDDEKLLGFVACTESTARLYRQALLRRGLLMALLLVKDVLRPGRLRRMWQTLRYPSQIPEALPPAEVLSIAVAGDAQGRGAGKALMQHAFKEFRSRGVLRARVAVGAANQQANAFYRRCGFALGQTHEHHGLPMNIYIADC